MNNQIKLNHSNVPLSELVCITRLSYADWSSRSQICPWITCPLHISWTLWKIFIKLYSIVRQWAGVQKPWLSYADSRSRGYFKVMGFTLHFRVFSISPEPFESFSLNFTQMFLLVRHSQWFHHSDSFCGGGFSCPSGCFLVNTRVIALGLELCYYLYSAKAILASYGPRHEKTCLRGFVNNKGADQTANPQSLISTFVIHLL